MTVTVATALNRVELESISRNRGEIVSTHTATIPKPIPGLQPSDKEECAKKGILRKYHCVLAFSRFIMNMATALMGKAH